MASPSSTRLCIEPHRRTCWFGDYAAAKAVVHSLTSAAATGFANDNIRVNAVLPA